MTLADFIGNNADALRFAIHARALRQSFGLFIREAWPHATGLGYVHGRHIDLLVRHLEAVAKGEISRLLINIPPSCSKSSLLNVLFPVWVWTWNPSAEFLCVSYSQQLSMRDSVACRELIRSDFYRSRYPSISATETDDSKQYFVLETNGSRRITTPGAMATGTHPDYILIDDPLSRDLAQSYVAREALRSWYFETLSTRGMALQVAHVVAMQRLHVDDLSGHIIEHSRQLERDHGATQWHHLMLGMRFDHSHQMVDRGYGGDWRTEPGELLYPELLTEAIVLTAERGLGVGPSEAQMQQRPQRRDGSMFELSKLKTISSKELPTEFDSIIRAWDLAASEDRGCYTVGCLMAKLKSTDRYTGEESLRFILIDVIREQTDNPVELMHQTARLDKFNYPDCRTVFESQPAAAGVLLSKSIIQRLRGFNVRDVRPMGSKETRAEPLSTAIRYGELVIVDGKWNSEFINELETFPGGKYSDQVDAASLAYGELIAGKGSNGVVLADVPIDHDRRPDPGSVWQPVRSGRHFSEMSKGRFR